MIFITRTHKGKVHHNNQDSLLAENAVSSLFAVADGMGGHLGGNVASAMAIETLRSIDLGQEPREDSLLEAVNSANQLIWERQLRDLSLSGMGTTLTAIWEGLDSLLVAHVGDSRAYRYYDGKLEQVTADHSLVGELFRSGAITAEMARNYPYRNIITRAVGTDVSLQTDLFRLPKQKGSRWLLCSDGLTEYAYSEQIIYAMGLPLEEAGDYLLQIALDGGGKDNITLILMEVPQ